MSATIAQSAYSETSALPSHRECPAPAVKSSPLAHPVERWVAPDAARIAATGRRRGLGLSADDVALYASMAGQFAAPHAAVETLRANRCAVPAPARQYWSPEPGSDRLGAWHVRCDLPPTGAGRLDGVRLVVKSTVEMAGIALGAGSALVDGYLPGEDATVVTRALAAGARIVGSGRTDDLCLALTGDTGHGGPVHNPWSLTHSTWGSSAGAAALVASGQADAAILVDQAGSGRAPAAGCGLVSLMPTRGRIPMTGVLGFTPVQDRVAVAARRTRLVAELTDALSGDDGRDLRCAGRPVTRLAAALRPVRGLRIGFVFEAFDHDLCDPAIVELFDETIERLVAEQGVQVRMRLMPDYRRAADVAMVLTVHAGVDALLAENLAWQPAVVGGDPGLAAHVAAARAAHPDQIADTVALCAAVAGDNGGRPDGYWSAAALAAIPALTADLAACLDGVDVLVTPTVPSTPPPLAALPRREHLTRALSGITHTCWANLTGYPAASVPLGLVGGLPVGLQAIAAPGNDALCLSLARAVEQAAGFPAAPVPHQPR